MISNRRDPLPLLPPARLKGLKVLIFGLGRFGGGLGAARFFCERGARVSVTDLQTADDLAEPLREIESLPIRTLRLGGHDPKDFERADWIVVNPAVPPGNPFLEAGVARGAIAVTEMDLFLRWCPSLLTAGVTGTNGKSTTVQLLNDMLEASGRRVVLGGNIGRAVLPEIDSIEPHDRVVVELSSFQLARLQDDTPRPHAVAITHYAPNHLDWHGDEEHYRTSKERLLEAPPGPDGIAGLGDLGAIAALPADCRHLERWRSQSGSRRVVAFAGDRYPEHGVGFDESWLTMEDSRGWVDSFVDVSPSALRGRANRANIACAATLACSLGANPHGIAQAILDFRPLPHRQERVGRGAGVEFVNDSKATTPEATRCALDAFGARVVLLAGGSSKQADFTELAQSIADRACSAVLFGATAGEIADALTRAGHDRDRTYRVRDLDAAFELAVEHARPGDTVLLSPACASFDQYANYEARGEHFRELAQAWCRERAPA